MEKIILFLAALVGVILAAPGRVEIQKTVASNAYSDMPVTLDLGNVGVNLGGFHASAGLGGLLTGDASKGGLHAEAGTPFGQEAGAGIGSVLDANGQGHAGAYAGATAGVVGAGSGFAHSDAGVVAGAATFGHKRFNQQTQVISEKTFSSPPEVVHERTVQGAPTVHRTVIEKTVIPQYVEKTIRVPSYVEKTIRVPTVEEHKVRVPVTPKVVENTYEAGAEVRPGVVVQKQYRKPLFGGFFGSFGASAGAGAGAGAGYGAGYGAGAGFTKQVTAEQGVAVGGYKPGLFNSIFNIPIQTLGAVNGLLNNIAGKTSGSVAISKSASYGTV